ncbi:MAG: Rho termination factor N-terminal domain-containing protein [Tenericutes bacterium]|nr:Rho termination factor N-terminal domain-containing protein [Mycoplasmatota bacterium]
MALYYKAVGNIEEMDKCFARVIANGKNHHTAIRSKAMFKGSVAVEDYVFAEASSEPQDVEIVEEPLQIDQLDEVEVIEEQTLDTELFEDEVVKKDAKDLSSLSVAELRDICREKGVAGYYKMKKSELISELEELDK